MPIRSYIFQSETIILIGYTQINCCDVWQTLKAVPGFIIRWSELWIWEQKLSRKVIGCIFEDGCDGLVFNCLGFQLPNR